MNSGTQLPVLSGSFPTGGFFSTSSGLIINAVNGRINPGLSTPGTYIVNYSGSTCNCVLSTTVTVFPTPSVSIGNMTVCSGAETTVAIIASPSTGLTYTWLNTGTNNYSLGVPAAQLNQSYTLDVTDANGCKNRAVKSGVVFTPQPIIVSGPNSACENAVVSFTATGASNYTWSTGALGNPVTLTVGAGPSITYTVGGKDINGCKSGGAKNIAVVNISPISVSDKTICASTNVTIIPQTDEAGISYTWVPKSSASTPDTLIDDPQVTQVYTLFAGIQNNQCVVTKTVLVTVIPSIKANVGFYYNSPLCTNSGTILPIEPAGFVKGGTYKSDLPIDASTGLLELNPSTEGQHIVTYSVATKECSLGASATLVLDVSPAVALDLPGHIKLQEGTSVNLTLSNVTWAVWYPPEHLSCINCADPVASPPKSMQYCVSGVINNCFTRSCVNVEVICHNPGDLSVPNAFTPNGDLNNDKFCLKGWEKCIFDFTVRIFNRWGEEVFSSDNPAFCWDGTYQGQLLNADVFVYVIKARYNTEPEFVKKGNITLLR